VASTRDHTKYEFEGEKLGKGRLVLAVVRRFVRDHPQARFADVLAAFPDRLQAETSVQFDKVRCVIRRPKDIYESSRRRFFVAAEELIHLNDDDIVVSREWNLENIQNVILEARKLGYAITPIPESSA
jgi:hypothetical protein